MQANQAMGGAEQQVTPETISADFGTRLVAYLIDGAILFVANIVITLLLGPLIAFLVSLAVGIGYVVYFWTSSGQTPGKMAMGLKVVSAETGQLLDPGTAALRYVGYILSSIPFGLGFLWVIWDPMHDGWHDKIAKTKVIKVTKS